MGKATWSDETGTWLVGRMSDVSFVTEPEPSSVYKSDIVPGRDIVFVPALPGYAQSAASEMKGIGDVNSTERGSGARFNVGKSPVQLLPLQSVLYTAQTRYKLPEHLRLCMEKMARFQEEPSGQYVREALLELYTQNLEIALEDAAKVFEFGSKKYAAWNWAKGQLWSVPLASATRHWLQLVRGQPDDEDSGLPHRGHMACNLIMLEVFTRHYPEGNDLPTHCVWEPA